MDEGILLGVGGFEEQHYSLQNRHPKAQIHRSELFEEGLRCTIGVLINTALIVTYTILVAPYSNYRKHAPKPYSNH